MGLQDILGGSKTKPPVERNKEDKKAVDTMASLWKKFYNEELDSDYFISPKDRKMLKNLHTELGEDAISALEYYTGNWKRIKYISGWPTINALYGFRKQLVMDMKHRPLDLSGQYTKTTVEEELKEWGL